MNWKRYGIFSPFIFILYIAYGILSLILFFGRGTFGASLGMMYMNDASENLSDGAKIYLFDQMYRKN